MHFPPGPRAARASSAGVEGFDGGQPDFPLVLGSVRGLRQWALPIAEFDAIMARSDTPEVAALVPGGQWPYLRGATGMTWPPGTVTAACNNYPGHAPPVEYDPALRSSCGCVVPGTRVLTADLRWVPAGDLSVGERLLAFDEYPADPGYGRVGGRKYREAIVASTERGPLPCYDLRFSDGTTVRVSADHRWLCYSGQKGAHWVRTDELRAGDLRASHVVKPFTPWKDNMSREAGYLAAAFDGEGHVHQRPGTPQYSSRVGFTQVQNEMLTEVECFLKALGYRYQHRISSPSPGQDLRIDGTPRLDKHDLVIGTRPELMKFLGEIRPVRLLAQFRPDLLGRLNMNTRVRLVEKAYAGEQEVVKLGTTAGTYFAEGLASHNCGFWAYWSFESEAWVRTSLRVFGVIEGTGRIVIGTKGFRCQKARIIALTPAFTVDTGTALVRQGWHYPARPRPSEQELAEARQRADAWMAVVMDLLGQMYPGARVFATLKGMLASVPPGEVST